MTKTQLIFSEAQLEALEERIVESASAAVDQLSKICASGPPLDALRQLKFEPVGFDPLSEGHLNFIEQINQTFTYLATFEAIRYLLKHHPCSGPFRMNLGTSSGNDICSQAGEIIAEVFASVKPGNNRKLQKEARKLQISNAQHRYVFFASPGCTAADWPGLKDCPGVRIVSLGDSLHLTTSK
jgi:hypothetical protein